MRVLGMKRLFKINDFALIITLFTESSSTIPEPSTSWSPSSNRTASTMCTRRRWTICHTGSEAMTRWRWLVSVFFKLLSVASGESLRLISSFYTPVLSFKIRGISACCSAVMNLISYLVSLVFVRDIISVVIHHSIVSHRIESLSRWFRFFINWPLAFLLFFSEWAKEN